MQKSKTVNRQNQLKTDLYNPTKHQNLTAQIDTPKSSVTLLEQEISDLVRSVTAKTKDLYAALQHLYEIAAQKRPLKNCPEDKKFTAEGFYHFGQNYSSGQTEFLVLLLSKFQAATGAKLQFGQVKVQYVCGQTGQTYQHAFVEIFAKSWHVLDPAQEMWVGEHCMFKYFMVQGRHLKNDEKYQGCQLDKYSGTPLDYYTVHRSNASAIEEVKEVLSQHCKNRIATIQMKHSVAVDVATIRKLLLQVSFQNQVQVSLESFFADSEFLLLQCKFVDMKCFQNIDQIRGLSLVQNAENQFLIAVNKTSQVQQETEHIIDEIYHICATQNFIAPDQVLYSVTDYYITFKFRLGAKITFDNCLNLDLDRKSYYDSQNPNNLVAQLIVRAANALCDEIPVSPKENLTMNQLNLINEIIKQKYPELWFLEITTSSNKQGVIHKIQIFKEDRKIVANLNDKLLEIKKQFESKFKDLIHSCSINQLDIISKYKLEDVIIKQLQQTEYSLNDSNKNVKDHLFDVVGCLINKKCTCQGFAAGFSFLAQISGLETVQVVGKSLKVEDDYDGVNQLHRWNMVKLNEWYHVDPTWLKPNVASRIYLNFSDKLRYSEVELFQLLNPPKANDMKLNYFQLKNKLLSDNQQVAKFVANVGSTTLAGDFYCTFNVDLTREIQNLRYSQQKDFQVKSAYSQNIATLHFYHFELTCGAPLLKGYPEIASLGQKYFVMDDGEFETRIQDLMRVSLATSVKYSKNDGIVEFSLMK